MKSISKIKLKNCPFFGGKAKVVRCKGDESVIDGNWFYWVQHINKKCKIRGINSDPDYGLETNYFDKPEEAAASWNKRVK